jgi:hypothetical protein
MTEIAAEHLWICEQMIDAQKRHTARLKTIGADVQNDMRPLLRHEAMRERPPAIGFFTTVQVTWPRRPPASIAAQRGGRLDNRRWITIIPVRQTRPRRQGQLHRPDTRAFVPEMGPLPPDRLKGSGNGGYYCEKVPGRIDVMTKTPAAGKQAASKTAPAAESHPRACR